MNILKCLQSLDMNILHQRYHGVIELNHDHEIEAGLFPARTGSAKTLSTCLTSRAIPFAYVAMFTSLPTIVPLQSV